MEVEIAGEGMVRGAVVPRGSDWVRSEEAVVLLLAAQEKPLSGLSGSSRGLCNTWGMPLERDLVMRDGIICARGIY